MQKKIIALAVAGLMSGGAFAQSNVTISGQMRVAVDNVRASGATAGSASDYTSRTRVTDQNSNIKFAGTEKVGNGLEAFWQVESAIGTDNNIGTSGSNVGTVSSATIGTRNTAVGVRGGFGEVFLGKWDAHYNSMAAIEGAGLADGLAMAANSLNLLNSINGGTLITGSGRNNNTINYLSPSFSGFQVFGQYGTGAEATTPGLAKKDNSLNLKFGYNNGPIALAYSYLATNSTGAAAPVAVGTSVCVNNTTGAVTVAAGTCVAGTTSVVAAPATTGNGSDIRSNRLGGSYSLPMGLKIGLIWDKSKNTNRTAAAGDTYRERSAWIVPVSYVMGASTMSFTYGKTGNLKGDAAAVTDATDAKMVMLGYEYALSKRTSVSATYVQINNNTNAGYDFWHPSSNVNGGATPAVAIGADPRMFSMGLKHTF